jgi:ABC-type nitrate/sulfonate/bicarbonate transport system substrate-binding protein
MSRLRAVLYVVAAALFAGAAGNAARAAEQVVLQLDGPAQFEFAGYYAALWQGFYRDAGLSVEIKQGAGRGQPPIDAVRQVTEGRAQFGTGTARLVISTVQGQPLLLLAPIFQQSGAMIYYRADQDIASPSALAAAKVGRLPASDILDIELVTALTAEGIDPAKLKSVALDSGQAFAALADRTVDAVPGSAWEMPWLAHEKGIALKSFNPADYRVEFYGDTLFTMQHLAKTQPQLVRRFYDASLKGWDYALKHPEEITTRLLSELPHPAGIADPAGFARYQADLARRLARYPQVQLGHSNPDRWQRIEASLGSGGALLRTADIVDFLYDPDAAARSRTDQRAFLILGVPLLGGIAVAVWLALRRWRRPRAAGAVVARRATAVAAPVPASAAIAPQAAPAATPAAPSTPAASSAPAARREPKAGPETQGADLNALLTRLERTIRQRVPRRVAFRLSLLPELWRCRAEAPMLRAVVLDLVATAVEDLGGGGELIVGTRNYAFDSDAVAQTPGAQPGDWVRVTVRDNGKGLADEALERIFDPLTTPRPSAAAAADAIRKLGGFARVESAEGVGTAVHLYFPRIAGPVENATQPGQQAKEAAA